jgi:hypothetical protein
MLSANALTFAREHNGGRFTQLHAVATNGTISDFGSPMIAWMQLFMEVDAVPVDAPARREIMDVCIHEIEAALP